MKKTNKGLTMAELLLATGILSIVISGILYLFISCMVLNQRNRNLNTAISHAQFMIEEWKTQDFTSMHSLINSIGGTLPYNISADNISQALSTVPLENEIVASVLTANTTPIINVNVTTYWHERGEQRNTSLSTIFTNY